MNNSIQLRFRELQAKGIRPVEVCRPVPVGNEFEVFLKNSSGHIVGNVIFMAENMEHAARLAKEADESVQKIDLSDKELSPFP